MGSTIPGTCYSGEKKAPARNAPGLVTQISGFPGFGSKDLSNPKDAKTKNNAMVNICFLKASDIHLFKLSRLGYWKVEVSIISRKYIFCFLGTESPGPEIAGEERNQKTQCRPRDTTNPNWEDAQR